MAEVRRYAARATSTDLVGRMEVHAREHRVLVDGPPWNGFPGEEIMPGELFLSALASCAVELLQMLAKEGEVPLGDLDVEVRAELDPDHQPRSDVRLFNRVNIGIRADGVTQQQAEALVEGFKGR
ncbi:MAG TPA: OsmC family protein [Actinomycetota bacterium]|nr:OsmC family protein [Actinomycetota bacterium]